MKLQRPELLPDPALSRDEMEELQRKVASEAVFDDCLPTDPGEVEEGDAVIAGVDQSFRRKEERKEEAVSAVVATRRGEVTERVHASAETRTEYIPGLLSFREGEAVVEALKKLSVTPDILLFDGSGRIHFRQAGIATHIGVVFDVPSVGVAKNLLCGRVVTRDGEDWDATSLDEGSRLGVVADSSVEAPDGTVIGYAYQSRQFESSNRHVNPLYVSPGHRVTAETAVDLVESTCEGYKLPEPTRIADSYADTVK
ncbi:endonuclease V [Halorutilales archaeon Cl-col2-1]